MKVLKIQQNSEEWLEFRKGKSGGSEFKDLWIPGYPLKSKIIAELEKDGQPLPPEDKKLAVADLAGMLEPEELAELKLAANQKNVSMKSLRNELLAQLRLTIISIDLAAHHSA